jgi:hypothetical protein
MADDIVEQLREAAKPDFLVKGSVWGQQEVRIALLSEAADEIERLRNAVDVLARTVDDDGARSDLDDVIDALGFDRSQLEAELDAEMPEWEAKRNGTWHSD